MHITLSGLCGKLYSCFCEWEVSFRRGIKALAAEDWESVAKAVNSGVLIL